MKFCTQRWFASPLQRLSQVWRPGSSRKATALQHNHRSQSRTLNIRCHTPGCNQHHLCLGIIHWRRLLAIWHGENLEMIIYLIHTLEPIAMTSYLMWCIQSELFTFVSSTKMIHEQFALLGYETEPGTCGDSITPSSSSTRRAAGESPQPGCTPVFPTKRACFNYTLKYSLLLTYIKLRKRLAWIPNKTIYRRNIDHSTKGKKVKVVLYSAVSNPLDRSKRFTLVYSWVNRGVNVENENAQSSKR